MRESPLKIAVLGLNDTGRLMLEAAKGFDCFTIAAVGDNDTNLAQQVAKEHNCAAYDDYRQLIMQNQLDCLFVAAPLHSCAEYLKMAIKKKFHILKAPPLARNFSEASEFVKLAQNEGITLAVANTDRFAQSSLAARGYFLQNSAEQPFLILAAAGQPPSDVPQATWRNDPVLAGGGVLLYECWEIIDQIVAELRPASAGLLPRPEHSRRGRRKHHARQAATALPDGGQRHCNYEIQRYVIRQSSGGPGSSRIIDRAKTAKMVNRTGAGYAYKMRRQKFRSYGFRAGLRRDEFDDD